MVANSHSIGGMITSTGIARRKSSTEMMNGSIHVPLSRAVKSPMGIPTPNTMISDIRPSCAEISILGKISSETE